MRMTSLTPPGLCCLSHSPASSSTPVLSWLLVFTSWSPGTWCCITSSCGGSGSSPRTTATGSTGSSSGILGHTSSRRPPWEASMNTLWSWTARSSARRVRASDGGEGALGPDFGWENLCAGTQGWLRSEREMMGEGVNSIPEKSCRKCGSWGWQWIKRFSKHAQHRGLDLVHKKRPCGKCFRQHVLEADIMLRWMRIVDLNTSVSFENLHPSSFSTAFQMAVVEHL